MQSHVCSVYVNNLGKIIDLISEIYKHFLSVPMTFNLDWCQLYYTMHFLLKLRFVQQRVAITKVYTESQVHIRGRTHKSEIVSAK
jgi:hypothetical protein